MPPNFTGRLAERAMLTSWLNNDDCHPLLVMRALGGFGKTALAWHWLTHDIEPATWPRVVWWSFYESDASFDHFLIEALSYLGARSAEPGVPTRDRVESLLRVLKEPGTLVVLDGFERELRAFGGLGAAYAGDEPGGADDNGRDCISPLAERFLFKVAALPDLRSKVLITTRLGPRVLEAKGGGMLAGCLDVELKQMTPADAVAFFRAEGIRGTHTEIEISCERYGYHPLSLRLLVGLIVHDLEQPGDIAGAQRIDVSGDLVQRQHHVLEMAYDSLRPVRQALLGRIACFRTPIKYAALKALGEAEAQAQDSAALDADLHDLVARGLLHHDIKVGRFDLHPVVRRYAYDRLSASDRTAAHTRLRDYFAAVPKQDRVSSLEDLAPVIELYHHTVRAGQYDTAFGLFSDRLYVPIYEQLSAYLLMIDLLGALFPQGEDRPPSLSSDYRRAGALRLLAIAYSLSGQPRRAVPLSDDANTFTELTGLESSLIAGLHNVAQQRLVIGEMRAAEADLRRVDAMHPEGSNKGFQYQAWGLLSAYRGDYRRSKTELVKALEAFGAGEIRPQGEVWADRALCELLRLRSSDSPRSSSASVALDSAHLALDLANKAARESFPSEHDFVYAHLLLGAAQRIAGEPHEAELHLNEALTRCRRVHMVKREADILVELARLCAASGAPDDAQGWAAEALVITERSGYVLQGADANLELAKLALARDELLTAYGHALEARRLATCDGPPDYSFKAAYDEAGDLLSKIEVHRAKRGV
jgi:tetratricopeptide (TPR) repeat protein